MYDCMTLPKSSTEPETTTAGQFWWDTSTNLIKLRNGANNDWVIFGGFDGTTYIPYAADESLEGALQTFTPVLFGSTTTGTQSYAPDSQQLHYAKIGSRVDFSCRILLTAFDPTTAGSIRVSLPLTSLNIVGQAYSVAVAQLQDIGLNSGYTQLVARIPPNSSFIEISQAGNNVAAIHVTEANMTSTAGLTLTGFYFVP